MAVTFPDRVYRESEVEEMWNKDSKASMKEGKEQASFLYLRREKREHLISHSRQAPLYLIALDGDKIVGYAGWIDKGDYNIGGGIRVREEYRGQKISSKLTDKRQEKIKDKPAIEMINTKTMDKQVFISKWKRRGWVINPDTEEVPSEIPKEMVEDFRKKAGSNWAVYSPTMMAKAWNILCKFTEEDAELFLEW
jgi:hypothetical protein